MNKDGLLFLEYKQIIHVISEGKSLSELDYLLVKKKARQTLKDKYNFSDSGIRGMLSRGAKQITPQKPSGMISEWEQIDDRDILNNYIYSLLSEEKEISTCMLNDFHFPFHHELAYNLVVKIVEKTKPTFCILGSDDQDNPNLGHWETPNELKDFNWFEENPKFHHKLVQDLREVSPLTDFIYIGGNHNKRVQEHFNTETNSSLRNKNIREWIEEFQMDGLVYYVPSNHVVIGDIMFMHESKGGDGASKGNFKANGYRHSQHGHVHRSHKYGEQTAYGYKTSVVTGCLCKHPYYDPTKAHSQWTLGIGYSNQWNGIVEQNPIDFHEQEDYICCWIGNEKLEVEI